VNNDIAETDEGNNCRTKRYGETYTYDFSENVMRATWVSSAGDLTLPLPKSNRNGVAFIEPRELLEDGKNHGSILGMYPAQDPGGWIQGMFADFYTDKDSLEPKSRYLEVPVGAKFIAQVGFLDDAETTDGVTFLFGAVSSDGTIDFYPGVFAMNDGQLDTYEVDLSDLAGQKRRFILRVEAGSSAEGDLAVWIEPKITQE
jgi:hypothetical protein